MPTESAAGGEAPPGPAPDGGLATERALRPSLGSPSGWACREAVLEVAVALAVFVGLALVYIPKHLEERIERNERIADTQLRWFGAAQRRWRQDGLGRRLDPPNLDPYCRDLRLLSAYPEPRPGGGTQAREYLKTEFVAAMERDGAYKGYRYEWRFDEHAFLVLATPERYGATGRASYTYELERGLRRTDAGRSIGFNDIPSMSWTSLD